MGSSWGPCRVAPEIIPVFEDRPIRFAGTFKFYYGGSTWDMTIQGDRVVHARTKQEVVFVMPTSASLHSDARRNTSRIVEYMMRSDRHVE
jgi:hypothetical protein